MIIVTLTTIPSRVKSLQPVIDNIIKQSLPPDRIELYIPKEYKKRSFSSIDPYDFPNGCDIIYCDEDYGPATKILPAIQKYKNQNVTLIYCDDDRLYDEDWIKRLVYMSEQYPNSCISENGFSLAWLFFKLWQKQLRIRYKLLRILSLGIWNPKRKMPSENEGFYDIAEGFGGVLIKPHFFPSEVFDIPDILWTVDDIWLSGMMEKNGINIRKSRLQKSTAIDIQNSDPLHAYVYKNHNRFDANMLCIKYFIDKYGIWQNFLFSIKR